jgi:hypothetical protein
MGNRAFGDVIRLVSSLGGMAGFLAARQVCREGVHAISPALLRLVERAICLLQEVLDSGIGSG